MKKDKWPDHEMVINCYPSSLGCFQTFYCCFFFPKYNHVTSFQCSPRPTSHTSCLFDPISKKNDRFIIISTSPTNQCFISMPKLVDNCVCFCSIILETYHQHFAYRLITIKPSPPLILTFFSTCANILSAINSLITPPPAHPLIAYH